ncbi:MAG: GTP-binding protein [Thermosynechococcus sp.]|uniref:GTP-binding protein n=1 Tax=Thermosynechococcus sp. TaxID=2814275 RepID=UPI00391CE124
MDTCQVIVVAGRWGAGKTHWIRQQLAAQSWQEALFYACPGYGAMGVDLVRMGYLYPRLQVLPTASLEECWERLPNQGQFFLEVGYHLDIQQLQIPLSTVKRVAIATPQETEFCHWADEVIEPAVPLPAIAPTLPELWQVELTGQVFDPPSLDAVLLELTEGAYGQVQRLKGIFELPDGQAFAVDFCLGLEEIEYTNLNVPPWLEGRPQRWSGLELIGYHLDKAAVRELIADAVLSDTVLAQYQVHYRTQVEAEG